MKILNLYAGLGGNRALWNNHHVTAIEHNESIASFYAKRFPNDTVHVGDAHKFLEINFHKFDFIWASPPCQTHSAARFAAGHQPKYPDMKLWQEILFLQHYFNKPWVVENVTPFYQPIIPPTIKIGRHTIWCNFNPSPNMFEIDLWERTTHSEIDVTNDTTTQMGEKLGISIDGHQFDTRKDQLMRNCVEPKIGQYLLYKANTQDWVVRKRPE